MIRLSQYRLLRQQRGRPGAGVLPTAKLEARAGDASVRRARTLARWLDQRFVDPVLGLLLPGVGDLATAGVGLYTVSVAIRQRLPLIVIARMLLNLALDAAIGVIPVVGDLFDWFHRANTRNVRLLEARYPQRKARVTDWLVVGAAFVAFLAAIALPILLLGWVISRGIPRL